MPHSPGKTRQASSWAKSIGRKCATAPGANANAPDSDMAATAAAPAPQPVRVVTCHAREGGEYFGTVDTGAGRRLAYAAKVDGAKLVSFKVL